MCTDDSLYMPIWNRSKESLKRALLLCIPLAILSYPLTSLYTKYILSRSPFSPKDLHSSALLGISPLQYTTWMLVFGQITFVIEWLLKKQLKKSRTEVYDRTVQSRGKRTFFPGFSQSQMLTARSWFSCRVLGKLRRRVESPSHRKS